MIRSGNPVLQGNVFGNLSAAGSARTMTVRGTVNKSFLLLGLVVLSASWVWGNYHTLKGLMLPALIAGFIVAMVTVFKKDIAPITAPVYALLEGVVLGEISAYLETVYPGIVMQAVMLTFGTLFSLLAAYRSGLIKVTERFKLGVIAATGGIFVFYLISMILGFFGVTMPLINSSGPLGIGFSLFVVVIAALNLVLDFDFIERGADAGAPGYMEWYGAFSLIVTLVWLYLEILRLLAKLNRR